jgi:GNAT superfamily N-acetyltransferase
VIREARTDEAEVLAEIQRDACLAGFAHIFPPKLYPFPTDDVRERWTTALADPDVSVLVAEVDERPVGLVGYRTEWLDGLYVAPDYWARGIGLDLHDSVLDRLRELGAGCCHLWVLEHNDRARRFYERHGWHENGETRVVPFPPNPIDVGYTIDLELVAPRRAVHELEQG